MGMAYVSIDVLIHLKQELAWATDKQLWIISNVMLFKTVPLKIIKYVATYDYSVIASWDKTTNVIKYTVNDQL